MSNNKKDIIYSAADIERYFRGNMPPLEMHAMEKAALDDPFLAEAMEGYSLNNGIDVQPHLRELKEKLLARQTAPVKNMAVTRWWRIAAAAAVFIGMFALALFKLNDFKNSTNTPLAKKDITTQPIEKKPGTDTVKTPVAEAKQEAATTHGNTPKKPVASPIIDEKKSTKTGEDLTHPGWAETKDLTVITNKEDAAKIINDDKYTVAAKKESARVDAAVSRNGSSVINANKIFSGKVTDNNNKAIPYAVLMINKHQTSKTDQQGMFNLSLPDSLIQLDITASNFYSKTISLKAASFKAITLEPQKNLFKKSKAKQKGRSLSHVHILNKGNSEPKEGWTKYEWFLVNNLSYSEYDDGSPVTGETIVSFEIDANGTPNNFNFDTSINMDVNEAIEELISNGPSWKIPEYGNGARPVKLKITF